jgi:geranylgeranyl reductase family protein
VEWDVVVVGAGPAGSAAALGALTADPSLRVLLLDRAAFPRDKACGDGVAPHVLDVLDGVGVRGLLDDLVPVRRLVLRAGTAEVDRDMRRPAYVVPRRVLDARLLGAARDAGAVVRRHRVRGLCPVGDGVEVDGSLRCRVLVGADGAHSLVRAAAGLPPVGRRALAIRGYAPTPPQRRGRQVIAFGGRQLAYAWSFDRGDGVANVGYGELLRPGRPAPSRRLLLDRLDELIPGAGDAAGCWRGHHLPLSSRRWDQPEGRLLLAGDAAGLVNPMTGEGIYYAVATGALAGRAAASAVRSGDGAGAGRRHRQGVRALLGRHLVHTAAAGRLVGLPAVVRAGVRAAAADQHVFDDLVELGLGRGRLGHPVAAAVLRQLA